MLAGGPTEIISHFAGLFHITVEEARARLEYTDGALKALSSDYVAKLPSYDSTADLPELFTRRSFVPDPQPEPGSDDPHSSVRKPTVDKMPPPKVAPAPHHDADKVPVAGASGGGGDSHTVNQKVIHVIKVTYGDDSEQHQASINQLNMINDDDRFGVPSDAEGPSGMERLPELVEGAQDQIPTELAFPGTDPATVVEFIDAYDAARAQGEGMADGEGTVADEPIVPGIYVNGELQPADYERPEKSDEEPPAPDLEAKGQWMELGGNTAINAAVIIDLNEAAPTLVVQGDFFQTSAIVQINAFIDNDEVHLGRDLPGLFVTDGNKADNIAEFVHEEGFHGALAGLSSGPFWNVDVLDGDVYDLNLLVQDNFLRDNDIVAQQSSNTHFMLVAGENGAYNVIDIKSVASSYDVIVIGGSGHCANLIFQTNILLDNDILKLIADGTDETFQSISSGLNSLLNDGRIITYGNDDFQPMSTGMQDLIGALDAGETEIDPSWHTLLPRNGGGPLDVLYIKGDYFDINAIWQTNVVADLDTALQLFAASCKDDGEFTQSMSTGGNELSNLAAIADVGSTFGFLGGDLYDDTILVQMNVVTEDKDTVVNKNPDALVAEVIAFTGSAEENDGSEEAFKPMPVPQDDMMGGVIT